MRTACRVRCKSSAFLPHRTLIHKSQTQRAKRREAPFAEGEHAYTRDKGGGSARSAEGRSPTWKRNWLGARAVSKTVRTRKGVGFETSLFLDYDTHPLVLVDSRQWSTKPFVPGSIPGGGTITDFDRPA
jgi:hypothetical protein